VNAPSTSTLALSKSANKAGATTGSIRFCLMPLP
jgi:hypothetical protein